MPFIKKLPEWNKPGTEPPTSLKNNGWAASQKPPADYFNWLQYTAYMALKELQEKAQHKDDAATIPDASITQKGITQLSSAVTSTAEDRAATPNAVKKVKDALDTHNEDNAKHVTADEKNKIALIKDGSTSQKGLVQLSSSTTSTSTTMAATPSAVKAAYDLANQAKQQANDGKTAVANAVTAKGVSASPADTFATLASKIGQIETGIKYATGTLTSSSTTETFITGTSLNQLMSFIEVSGIDFTPKIIIVLASPSTYDDGTITIYNHNGLPVKGYTNIVISVHSTNANAGNSTFGSGFTMSGSAYVSSTGFKLPVRIKGVPVIWYAYGD